MTRCDGAALRVKPVSFAGNRAVRIGRRLRRAGVARGRRFHNPISDRHDPLVAEQVDGLGPLLGIAHEAALQEVDALRAELVRRRQGRWVALRDVVHDGPLVVQVGPRSSPGGHLEDDAAERPDVHGTKVAWVLALDDFGRHVHGRSRHGLVGLGAGEIIDQSAALASDHLGRAEVDVFDDAVMVEEDVCALLASCSMLLPKIKSRR